MPFNIIAADNGDAWVEAHGKKMAPPQVSAETLKKMKKTAEDFLGQANKISKSINLPSSDIIMAKSALDAKKGNYA